MLVSLLAEVSGDAVAEGRNSVPASIIAQKSERSPMHTVNIVVEAQMSAQFSSL